MRALAVVWLAGCRSVIGIEGDVCELEPFVTLDAPCRAMPPSCGCGAGTTCIVDYSVAERSCAPPGTTGLYERCTEAAECAEGAVCRRWPGAPAGACLPYCYVRADCERARSDCFFSQLNGVAYCEEGCTPGDGDDCGEGLACQINEGTDTTFCRPRGTGAFGDPCGGFLEQPCDRGLSCTVFRDGNVCRRICGNGLPACEAPMVCAVNLDADSARRAEEGEYGVCLTLT